MSERLDETAIVDVLMITYNRAAYTRLALDRLLSTCDERTRVWLWHNGDDEETLSVVRERADHPAVHRFHHCPENRKLTTPTNWLWSHSDAPLWSKVDDDSLVPEGWVQRLRRAHIDEPRLGAICCWRCMPEDDLPEAAEKKVRVLPGGQRLMMHSWVEGSGYVMKRQVVEDEGLLEEGESFPVYLKRSAWRGWMHGWYYPFAELFQEHMDDPRAEHTLIRSDADLATALPLTARRNGVDTIAGWEALIKDIAHQVQRGKTRPGRLFWPRSAWYRLTHPRRGIGGPIDVG